MRNPLENKKVKELLARLRFDPDFNEAVLEFRRKFGIPVNGYRSKSHVTRWKKKQDFVISRMQFWNDAELRRESTKSGFLRKGYSGTNDYRDFEFEVLGVFKLPFTARAQLEEILLSDGRVQMPDENICDIEVPSEGEIEDRGQRFIRLVIYDHISSPEVKAFITRKWREIERAMGKTKQPRIRTSTKRRIHDLVHHYWSQSPEELGMKKQHRYKEILIAEKLRTEHGIDLKSDNVKRIAMRQRKIRSS